jgi:hypothetical protein
MMEVKMKTTALWDVAPCSLTESGQVSEVRTSSIIRAINHLSSARIHRTISQKAVIFILIAVRT